MDESLEQNLEKIKKEIKSCTNKRGHAELLSEVVMELQKSILLEALKAAAIYKKREFVLLSD